LYYLKDIKKELINLRGGVGTEYNLIIKDIEDNPNKYILVSFDEISKEIIPLSFKSREILDLRNPENFNKLDSKLQDKELIHFSEVGSKKPEVKTVKIPALQITNKSDRKGNLIELENGVYKDDNTGKLSLSITDIQFFKHRQAYFTAGKKGLIRIDSPVKSTDALCKILRNPVTFDTSHKEFGTSPVCWWRGSSWGKVERVEKLSDSIVLINKMELKLKCVYLFAKHKDKNRFIYAEFMGLQKTFINGNKYNKSLANYKERKYDNYVYEMYAIHENQNYTLEEAHDGFAKRNEKTIKIGNNYEERERFLTPFNLLISPYNSPLNESSKRYKWEHQRIMDEIILGEGNIQDYLPEVLKLMNSV